MKKEAYEAASAAFDIEARAIAAMKGCALDEAFAAAVDALATAERIGVSGCGHSGIAAQHFAHLLNCIERPAKFIPTGEAVHGGMGFIKAGDILVLASRGGKTAELLPMMRIAKEKGARVIAITEREDSPMAQEADIYISMKVERECDKYNSQSTASFVALSSLFDALQTAILEETDFKNERFALIHPGGAVGERLNK